MISSSGMVFGVRIARGISCEVIGTFFGTFVASVVKKTRESALFFRPPQHGTADTLSCLKHDADSQVSLRKFQHKMRQSGPGCAVFAINRFAHGGMSR